MDFTTLEIIGFIGSIILSAFFSASETALNSLTNASIRKLIAGSGRRSKLMKLWVESPGKVLSAILIGNNLANVAASVLASSLALSIAREMGSRDAIALAIVTGIVTFILLVFGEVSPKTYAQSNSSRYVRFVSGPLYVVLISLKPASWMLAKIAAVFVFLIGGETKRKGLTVTEQEIISLVEAGEKDGTIEKEEKSMIHSVIELGDTIVREIMVPRVDIIGVDVSSGMDEVLHVMSKHKLSRMPVYEETMDNVVGIIHIKNVMAFWRKNVKEMPAIEFVAAAYFVPETKRVAELLAEFRERRIHLAIVVDEFGGTAGLVTLEDIVEEIVGEIEDEHDTQKEFIREKADGGFLIDSRIDIDELNSRLELSLPDSEYNTLGGFISSLVKRLPKRNERIMYGDLTFVIREVDKKRINTVELLKK